MDSTIIIRIYRLIMHMEKVHQGSKYWFPVPFFRYFCTPPCIYPLKFITFHSKMRLARKGGWLMKKGCILLLLMSVISLPLIAQNIIYSNLKELLAQYVDTVAVLRV